MDDGMAGVETHRAEVLRIAATYGARNVRVFGAVATGDAGADSDLDLLVDMDPDRSLFDLVDLGQELSSLLGRPVEVLASTSLSPRLRAKILAEARSL